MSFFAQITAFQQTQTVSQLRIDDVDEDVDEDADEEIVARKTLLVSDAEGPGCPHSHPVGSYHLICAGSRVVVVPFFAVLLFHANSDAVFYSQQHFY